MEANVRIPLKAVIRVQCNTSLKIAEETCWQKINWAALSAAGSAASRASASANIALKGEWLCKDSKLVSTLAWFRVPRVAF